MFRITLVTIPPDLPESVDLEESNVFLNLKSLRMHLYPVDSWQKKLFEEYAKMD